MAINNDRNLLEQQILSNSGLKGKELENLKARLATLSEQQLQAELSKSLSGNNKGEWYTGVMLEHNESVVMRNNHDQTTYTDDNGNEISELKDGDEVLERTIKSTDDKGNTFEITVTFSGGRPLTQIKSKNGNTTETTTYKYNDDADVPFVTVETKKADQSKVTTNVLEVDINGDFANEDFIDRKTTLLDGTEIFITKENGRLTENVKKVGKPEVTTVYNGDNVQDLDSKKLNRLKQNEVYYDGKGNTYVQINAGETAQIMADRINKKRAVGSQIVTAQQIIELNPNLVKKNGEFVLQKFENGVKGLGEVRIPGEFDANSPFIRTRQSIQKANNLANQAEIDKQIATKVTKNTDKKFVAELANNGFKPTRENAIFYNRFNALNPTQQQNVLSVIKYCKNQKITDPNKIKARILETFPEINLFDSGKTIPQTNNNVPLFQRKNPVALETFLTETLKLDLKSETGAMVYEKLASLPQEHLNKINAQNFSDLSKANFVEIAQRLEANGIDIRSRQEHQIENNSPRMKAEQERRELRESASQNIALAYDNAINIIKQYQGNQGWINVGFYREKLGKLLSNVNPTKINTCFDDVIKELEKEKKFAVGYLKGKCTNDKEFKEAFKKVSGGVEYNEANMKAFLDVAQDQSANFEDEKYNEKFWNAYNKAFGVAKTDKNGKVYYEPQVVKQATSRTNFQQYVDGAGDIVLMLLGTEAIGKGVAWAGGKLISKVSPYVPKFLANAGSKTVMTIGSNNITVGRVAANMASQSASFTLWDASKNYINLKTKDIQYSGKDAEKEWEAYKEGNVESAKFGAFAGALNTTVVGKVINGTMKMFEKPIAKAISKVGKSFEKTSAMSGSDVMKTFMLNQTPGALAKTAGTIAEIGGFTLYETANEVVEELLKKGEDGHLPAELTENGLTSYLLDKLGGQAKNLGEIKAISRLMFMHKGAIKEQARLIDENLAKCETLKNVQIKKTEVNGREIFEVTLPDGNRKVANSVEEVIANCNVLMQLDMISNAAKENTNKKRLSSVETEIPDLTEALSTVAEVKVKRAWQHHDIKTSTPDEKVDLFNLDLNAGLKEPIQDIKNEVTSLVLKNKLRDALDTRFKIEDDKFNKILQSHKNEISNLAKKYSNNNQAFCQELVNILSKDFGLSEFKPTIRIIKDNELEGNGGFDSSDGTINISEKVKNINEIVEIVSHEFIHHLQYLNLIAQYGEQGVKELLTQSFDFEYDNSLTDEMKTNIINERLNSEYNKKILSNFKPQNQDGTVASYINSVYKDEMTNIPTPGTPQYFAQITELEAYHIGSKNGVNLEIENHGIDELNNNNSNLEFYMHYVQELIHRNHPGSKYDRITGIKLPELPQKLQRVIRNNPVDANFDRVSELNIREQLAKFVKNNSELQNVGEITNEQSLFIQELIHRNHPGSKYDRITGIKLPELPKKLQKIIRNNPNDANFDRVSGLNIREQLVEYLETNKINQQKENTNKRHKTVLAGYTITSDAEFATQGRELCRRSDGTESPAARALLEAVKNSDLSNNSYDINHFKLDDFKKMTRDYQGNLYSEEMLSYAKEIVESIPKGKDEYLIEGTDFSIGSIIMFQLEYAKPEAKRQIVDATKQLMSNPTVRNSVVDEIIKACTEGDSKEGYTFNQKTFLKIRDMLFNKTENHKYDNDYSYSLRVAEMAKSSIKDGKFSDIYFEIAKLYDKTSSHIVHITFDQDFTSFGQKDLSFDKFDKSTQDVMKKMLIEKIKQDYRSDSYDILKIAESGGWGPTDYNLPKLFACDYLMKNIDGLKPYDLKKVVDSFSYDNLLNDLETFINNYKKLSETNICNNEHSKFYILSELKGLEIKDIMPFIRNKDFNKYDYSDLKKIFDLLRALKGMGNSTYTVDRWRLFEITDRILPNAELTQAFKEAGVDVVAEREKLMNTQVYQQATAESPANKSNFIGNILSNKIDITSLDSAELLKRIEEGIPEFANVKDKEKYVDMLKNIVNSPEFENLDNTSKSILKYTIITLPLNRDVTQSILKQYGLPDYLINRIKKLKEITNMTNLSDYFIDYQASYLQNGQSFDIFKLIVSKMTTINPEYKIPDLQKLDEKINQARQNTNILYPSKIINQSLIPTQNTNIGGNNIPIQYLDLSSIDTKTDLSKYGFNPGTTVENALLLLHMFNFDTGDVQPKFIDFKNAVDNPNSDGITASASAKKLLNGGLFGDGVGLLIAGSENSSYPAALDVTFHSNLKKTDMTYSQWLFDSRRGANPEENTENWYQARALSFLKDNFLAELKQNNIELTNEEYGILVSQLPRYKTAIKDITIRDKTIPKDIILNVINATEDALTKTGGTTEVLVNQPQIQAFVITEPLENISSRYPSLVLLSNQYNIPIIRIK